MTVRVREPKRPVSSFVRPLSLKQAFHSSAYHVLCLGALRVHATVWHSLTSGGQRAGVSRWIMHAGQDKEHILKVNPHASHMIMYCYYNLRGLQSSFLLPTRNSSTMFNLVIILPRNKIRETNSQTAQLGSGQSPKAVEDSQFSIASWRSIRSRGDKASWIGHGWWFCMASSHLVSKNIRM
jgi:hypothetical protein